MDKIELSSSVALIAGSVILSIFSSSISKNGIPFSALSPTLRRTDLTIPFVDAGISIAALSVSKTRIESSEVTFCPGSTEISITSTSSTSPRSGRLIMVFADIKPPKG